MAKKKENPTPAAGPSDQHPGPDEGEKVEAVPVAAHPVAEVAETVPAAPVNIVDTPGTSIIVCGHGQDVLDATIEEPTYPAQEWQQPAATAMVLPSEEMTDDSLVDLIRGRQGEINFRLKRDLEDYWVIGASLNVLYRRHAVEKIGPNGKPIPSKWRSEWLTTLGINHTSDQQLRVFARKFSLDEVGQFGSKTEALRACGFSIGGVTKAIEHQRSGAVQGRAPLGQAEPIEADLVAESATQPQARKVAAKLQPPTIAVQTAPVPDEEDPIAEGEAFVVTLGGALIADLEAAAIEAGLTPINVTAKRVVGLLWYGDDEYKPAREKVAKAIEKLRTMKKRMQIEARYLKPTDVISV